VTVVPLDHSRPRGLGLVEQGIMKAEDTNRLSHGPPELRQTYARLVMDEVGVSDDEISIIGAKSLLERCAAANETPAAPAPNSDSIVYLGSGELPHDTSHPHCYLGHDITL
jgi:hypothetical protein